MRYAMWFAVLGLAACKPTDSDTTDTDLDTGGSDSDTDTGEFGCGGDPSGDIVVDWDRVDAGGAVTISLGACATGATGFYLGMAETASGENGWYGEDCADQGDCHHFVGTAPIEGSLTYVETIGDVVPGSTTLFDGGTDGSGDAFTADDADRLTYIFQIEGGDFDRQCYVWGDDPSYYVAQDCQEL
jgi:hypothetical protein